MMPRNLFRLLFIFLCAVLASPMIFVSVAQNNRETIMLPMPDAITLATDVYRPDADGAYPTLLMRTPYGRGDSGDIGELVNDMGIVFVVQDIRGRFDSGGEFSIFRDDRADGHTTINWITEQPWSNGKVATFGGSALGITQYMLAPDAGDGLVCQWVEVGTSDLQATTYPNGAYRSELFDGWLRSLGEEADIADIRQHPTEDDWWESTDTAQNFSAVKTTAIHIGGWYDIFAQHTIDAFLGYQTQSQQPDTQFLIMGPWTHAVNSSEIGELFIENAPFERYEELLFLWLNACLVDENPAVLTNELPPVTYFTIGAIDEENAPGNTWHTAQTWPPSGGVDTPMYLGANNSLNYVMSATEGSDTFRYDPDNPTETICGANLIIAAGSCDQREIERREDVLVYETDILDTPLEVTGDIRAQIWMETDVPDTDIVVRITDVYPDGRSMLVVDGIMRARYHNSPDFSTETLLITGEPTLLEFAVAPTSYIFNTGHRLRVSITSSNVPRFAPNPNTGAMFFNEGEETRIATTAILWRDAHPSAIILPVHD
jgi:uncharacterized protein